MREGRGGVLCEVLRGRGEEGYCVRCGGGGVLSEVWRGRGEGGEGYCVEGGGIRGGERGRERERLTLRQGLSV